MFFKADDLRTVIFLKAKNAFGAVVKSPFLRRHKGRWYLNAIFKGTSEYSSGLLVIDLSKLEYWIMS